MPRASLSASTPKRNGVSQSNSTVKRSSQLGRASASTPTSTTRTSKRKRPSPSPEVEEEEEKVAALDEDGPVDDAERELEAWQDFAAEYYEIVEQLPLELHRNFRLLRELDESCNVQTARLERMVRSYIAHRLKPPPPPPPRAATEDTTAKTGQIDQPSLLAEGSSEDATALQDAADEAQEEPSEQSAEADEQEAEAVEHQVAAASMGVPRPDGHGGLVLPPEEPTQDDLPEPRRAFPSPGSSSQRQSATPLKPETPHKADPPNEPTLPEDVDGDVQMQSADAPPAEAAPVASSPIRRPPPSSRSQGPGKKKINMLPEIAKLVKEIVRNGEEKLALAVGAYNSIDRHIRALDSALSAQEASMILGLRPSTLPSAAVEGTPVPELPNEDPDADVVIGITGGNKKNAKNNKNSKKDKKGKAMPAQEKGILEQERERLQQTGIVIEFDAPSSEPRYCYCQQVSHGEMIGCDNDDCPLEWFHLPCVGLQRPPTGSWYCELCKPAHQPQATTSHKKKSRKSR